MGLTSKMPFTVVIPVRATDFNFLKRNLSSWLQLKPDELILCFDKPVPKRCVAVAKGIARAYGTSLRILEVEPNKDYTFHQAWVRRSGFRAARNDVILTGDIDLKVYPACLRAVNLVGKDGVGLVSVSKRKIGKRGVLGRIRNFNSYVVRRFAKLLGSYATGKAYFTGLYALYRPCWFDSENEDGIKQLRNPKYAPYNPHAWGGYTGEDTFLRDSMMKKHELLYLPDIGADDLNPSLEDTKPIQIKIGRKFAFEGRNPLNVLRHTIIHLRPYVFSSYLRETHSIYNSFTLTFFHLCKMGFKLTAIYTLIGFRTLLGRVLKTGPAYGLGKKALASLMTSSSAPDNSAVLATLVNECIHEFPVSVKLKRLHGDLFVDVGSCYGYYALLLQKNFKRIVAFEPAQINSKLERNLATFNADNVTLIKKAVYNIDGPIVLFKASYAVYDKAMLIAPEQLVEDKLPNVTQELMGKQIVEAVTLATYFKDEPLIDLVKVDVEGADFKVLEGAKPIMNRVQRWLIELHYPEKKKTLEGFMEGFGYCWEWLTEKHLYAWRATD